MSNIYDRVSQLIPGCLYASYKTVELTILGSVTDECSIEQEVLLWITLCLFTILCFLSSLLADSNVTYSTPITGWLTNHQTFRRFVPPLEVHTCAATVAFITLIIFNPPTFSCLFSVGPNDILVQTIPILIGTLLLTAYSMIFTTD